MTWCLRIGTFNVRKRESNQKKRQGEVSKNWFLILIIMIRPLLIIGEVEMNPGPLEKGDISIKKLHDLFDQKLYKICLHESITNS